MTKIPATFWIFRTGEGTKEHAFREELGGGLSFSYSWYMMYEYVIWILLPLLVSFSQHFLHTSRFVIDDRVGVLQRPINSNKNAPFMTRSGISCGAGTLPWRWDGWKRPRVRVLFLLHMAFPFVSSSEEGNIWEFGSILFHLLSSSVCRWTCVRGPCNNVLQRRLLFDCWEDEFLG